MAGKAVRCVGIFADPILTDPSLPGGTGPKLSCAAWAIGPLTRREKFAKFEVGYGRANLKKPFIANEES